MKKLLAIFLLVSNVAFASFVNQGQYLTPFDKLDPNTVAGRTATQTLTNKTLVNPIITGGTTISGAVTVTSVDSTSGTFDTLLVTSANITTGTFNTITASSVSNVPLLVPGQVQNLSWTKAAGVITIAGANGTALSASNPAWVCVPSAVTAGTHVVLPITANATFTDDDGASDFVSGGKTTYTFGVTSGVAWNTYMPFFIYVLNKDDTAAGIRFAVSRQPNKYSPATADLGDSATAPATPAQTNMFVFPAIGGGGADDYNGKVCQLVGATWALKAGVAQDWTFLASDKTSGFGSLPIDTVTSYSFTFPVGQNGAAANSYQKNANNNTVSTGSITYSIDRQGYVALGGEVEWTGAGGATAEIIVLPYSMTTISGLAASIGYDTSNYFRGAYYSSTKQIEFRVLTTNTPPQTNSLTNKREYFNGYRYKAF